MAATPGMIAILGGLGAAAMWAAATVCSSRSSRMMPPASVLAFVMIVGLVVTAPAAVRASRPAGVDGADVWWLVAASAGNVAGLLLEYAGLSVGKVGVVAPIASTEGAVAALLAVAAGERLDATSAVLLAVIATGVALAAKSADEDPRLAVAAGRTPSPAARRAALLAVAAAGSFGVGLYAAGRLSSSVPAAWVIVAARLVGVVAVALPLVATRRLRLPRAAVPLLLAAGLAEVLGFVSFLAGARSDIAVTAVLASQFAAIASIAAFVLFRERLARVQVAGVCGIAVGVALLAARA
jgi:drug/metabolite transporter (DMT)-like permease